MNKEITQNKCSLHGILIGRQEGKMALGIPRNKYNCSIKIQYLKRKCGANVANKFISNVNQ
jgi:hypothetical protein